MFGLSPIDTDNILPITKFRIPRWRYNNYTSNYVDDAEDKGNIEVEDQDNFEVEDQDNFEDEDNDDVDGDDDYDCDLDDDDVDNE